MKRLEPAESVVARLRPHPRSLFWPVVLLLTVAAGAGFVFGRLPEEWMTLTALAVGAVLLVVGVLVPVLRRLTRSYTITTRRTIVRSGALRRQRRELLHRLAGDVTLRRSPLQALVGAGDIELSTRGEQPLVLRDVPHAKLVLATFHDLMDDR